MQRAIVLAGLIVSCASPALSQTCADRSSDYTARIALCDQAFDAATTNDDAAYALSMKGEAQRLLGDLDAAASTLQYALSLTPENAWVWVELGNVEYERGNTAGSIAHYSAALAVEDYVDAWANRADGWWALGMHQRCSDDADQALRLDPQYAYANEVKGRCLIGLGLPDQALGYFDVAISASPGYHYAYRNKMSALFDLQQYQEVVALADLTLTPGTIANPSPRIEEEVRGLRLLAMAQYGPPDMVLADADDLLRRYPENYTAVNIKGMALVESGDAAGADQATQPLRRNIDGSGMEGAFYDTLAQIDLALGRLDQAYANFEAALNRDPSMSKVYARKLSELGFLPLSNAPPAVLTALRRCIDVKKTACTLAG